MGAQQQTLGTSTGRLTISSQDKGRKFRWFKVSISYPTSSWLLIKKLQMYQQMKITYHPPELELISNIYKVFSETAITTFLVQGAIRLDGNWNCVSQILTMDVWPEWQSIILVIMFFYEVEKKKA